MEPSEKRLCTDSQNITELISSIQYRFFERLQKIEEKVEMIISRYSLLENKIQAILCNIQGVPHETSVPIDYPDGSWLGDPDDPNLRFRCNIRPEELKYLDRLCLNAEKMSLKLLDLLFDRNIQASSNLSGTGKHRKQQLDPLKIFGIKCHVTYKFGITEEDWNRIRLNLDSKCRSAFKRKRNGQPLCIRSSKSKSPCTSKVDDKSDQSMTSIAYDGDSLNSVVETATDEMFPPSLEVEESVANIPLPEAIESFPIIFPDSFNSQYIDTDHGTIQVIQATLEQFEQLKHNPHIEVLSETPLT